MQSLKKISTITATLLASLSLLTGCASQDKTAVQETADNFLSIVKSGTNENIEKYASAEVSEGEFVKTFDSEYLKENFKEGFVTAEIDEETLARVDSFCALFSDMVTDYSISDVSVDKSGVGTVTAIINTAFPIDVIDNSQALEMISEEAESYYAENEETINSLYEEKTEEEVAEIVYNDMIIRIINVYEALINEASPESYAIKIKVEKNTETDSWYVTDVSSYDNASSGTTTAATETATTVEASSSATETATTEEASSAASSN